MKLKATRSEIRECVEKAVMRIVNEGKSQYKNEKSQDEKSKVKHGKLNKKGFPTKQKGNKGNQNWKQFDDED